jgi:hypothetical protein
MYMSTSPHNAPAKTSCLYVAHLTALFFFATGASCTSAAALEQKVMRAAVVEALARDEGIPADEPPIVALPKTGTHSNGNHFSWIPLEIKYKSLSNSYCRTAIFDDRDSSAWIIPVPEIANFSTCSGYRHVLIEDVNGDGKSDFIAEVSVKSNRYPKPASEAMVYLSTSDKEGEACYSRDASRAVVPSALWDSRSRPVPEVIERLRKMNLVCNTTK